MRVRFVVRGRVQGVSFRYHTQAEARARGLAGWVRNLPSGEVEGEVAGDAAAVEALIAWCKVGPPAARVDGVDVTPSNASDALPSDFAILR